MGESIIVRREKNLAELTMDATATAAEIKSGKTAYANGVKVTGTAFIPSAAAAARTGYSGIPYDVSNATYNASTHKVVVNLYYGSQTLQVTVTLT